jgi:hypothetical protein
VPLALIAVGIWLLLRRFDQVPKPSGEQLIGYVLAFLACLLLALTKETHCRPFSE